MSESVKDPALAEIIGALILGADHPLPVREIRRLLEEVAAERRAEQASDDEITDDDLLAANAGVGRAPDEEVKEGELPPEDDTVSGSTGIDGLAIRKAIAGLQEKFAASGLGMSIVEVVGGFRLQTSPECGPWVRKMLNRGKPARISRPMLETLAIIAYRQPVSRSEIESIRGVGAGHVVKALMEMQLVRIIGRSNLPGRPFLFGTTPQFLQHFGLKSLNELSGMQPGIERVTADQARAMAKGEPIPPKPKFGRKNARDDGASAADGEAAPELPLGEADGGQGAAGPDGGQDADAPQCGRGAVDAPPRENVIKWRSK